MQINIIPDDKMIYIDGQAITDERYASVAFHPMIHSVTYDTEARRGAIQYKVINGLQLPGQALDFDGFYNLFGEHVEAGKALLEEQNRRAEEERHLREAEAAMAEAERENKEREAIAAAEKEKAEREAVAAAAEQAKAAEANTAAMLEKAQELHDKTKALLDEAIAAHKAQAIKDKEDAEADALRAQQST